MNLRKTFFILPNLFTLSSVFCGFYAMALVAGGGAQATPDQLYQAAIAICFGVFFDVADGRVARLTRTQSALGMQLDSLADVMTFGAAPALMTYRAGLSRLTSQVPVIGPYLGVAVAFAFVACAALRLARFNVLAMNEAAEKKKSGKYFLGLPVPAAAAVLVSLVLVNRQIGGDYAVLGDAALAVLVLVLAALMVSRIRFRSFKDVKLSRRTVTVAVFVVGVILVALFVKHVQSGLVFLTILAVYVSLGLMEEIIFFRRRRLEEAAARAPEQVELEADGGAHSDREVLEELGAFDDTGESDESAPSSGSAPAAAPPRTAASH